MIFKDKHFPYPIIKSNEGDFTNSIFKIKNINNNYDNYNIEFELTNDDIYNLIINNKASLVLHLEESETMYRTTYKFNTLKYNFTIPNEKVRRRVELSAFIVMNENINDFYSSDLDLIYNDINISYEKHNIIGYSDSKIIKINKETDDIKNVRSIFSLISDKNIKDIYEVSLMTNSIVIKMNEQDYKNYAFLVNRFNQNESKGNIILLTILIMPSFVQVLNQIHKNTDDYRSYNWFDSLIKAFEKKDVDILNEFKKDNFDAYKHAQIVFDGVISGSIREMRSDHIIGSEK